MKDIPAIILASAALVTSLATLIASIATFLQSRKNHAAIDGKMEQLIRVTGESEYAKGAKSETDKQI